MRNLALPGYLTFPNAVHLWASITHPGEAMSNGLFEELAAALCQELLAKRLRAYLLVLPRVAPSRRSNASGFDEGKQFEIAAHYWATENASDAIHDRWVEAPVLEPLPPSAHRQVNKGGYVLLEEKALCALIAGEDPADERASTADLFGETYWSIPQALCWAATRSAKAMARYFIPAPRDTFSDVFYRDEIHALLMSMKRDYSPLRANVEDIETAARLDRIQIEGREDGRSPWRPIPKGDWGGGQYSGGLKLGQRNHNGGIEAADQSLPRKVWTDLRVRRAQVMSVFRAERSLPDILAEDHWNFAMAVAWICWRRGDAARVVWPRWLELQSLNRGLATVFGLRNPIDNVTASEPISTLAPPAVSIDDAIADLLSRLRKGDIGASFRGEPIARERWGLLTHEGYLDGPHYAGTNRLFACDWEILILRSEVLELWRDMSLPPAAPPVVERERDSTPKKWTSAAAWYRSEGRKAAEDKLKADGSRLTEGRIQRAASDVWNAMPCNKDRKVNPGAFKKADKRALKKGAQGTQKRGAGDTL
jgi:hypothetical protein